MRKTLTGISIFWLLFISSSKVAMAAPVDYTGILNSSRANGSPLIDCVGPDSKHFQSTSEACQAFNRAWGRTGGFLGASALALSPMHPGLAQALADTNSPTGDCVGPDNKHFQTNKNTCEVFNRAWGKPANFMATTTTSSAPGNSSLGQLIEGDKAKGVPLGDCIGPDKKHFDSSKGVCEAFNKAWGKSQVSFTAGVTTGTSVTFGGSSSSSTGNSSGNQTTTDTSSKDKKNNGKSNKQ